MNVNITEVEQEHFSIEVVVVPYSNIEITHVNDNARPVKITVTKIIVWIVIVAMIVALFVI
ncbi:MAG: hypothetical protein LBQ08_04980 [Holosporaceae bacterium]|jgi:hypothetical protein|nr:hypothetical protein [Holosporaceae bacterium]